MSDEEHDQREAEDMSMPPVFTKNFYSKLALFAKEFRTSRVAFALKAIERYAAELRKEKTFSAKTLGNPDLSDRYKDLVGKVSKSWWAQLTAAEKTARARKAAAGRWSKMTTKKK